MTNRPPRRMPRVEVRDVTEDFIKFVLYDTDLSIANALRFVLFAFCLTPCNCGGALLRENLTIDK